MTAKKECEAEEAHVYTGYYTVSTDAKRLQTNPLAQS